MNKLLVIFLIFLVGFMRVFDSVCDQINRILWRRGSFVISLRFFNSYYFLKYA